MIYFLFEPLDVKKQDFKDVPQFDLGVFTLYELDTQGLTTLMTGKKSVKYSDRYEVKDIDYTDNSKEFIANMQADRGLYKDDIVDLEGNVLYSREDGLVFESDEITYNKKTTIAISKKSFVMYRDGDIIHGTSLEFNNLKRQARITDVVAKYKLEDVKWDF